MRLKKKLLQIPFSNKKTFNLVYENDDDLKLGIISLVKHLGASKLIVQVLANSDVINKELKDHEVIKQRKYNYYLVDNLDFLNPIHLCAIRYLAIYSFDLENMDQSDISQTISKADCIIWLDNYLETAEVEIDSSKYGDLFHF